MPTFEATVRPPFGSVLFEKDMPSELYYKERMIERLTQVLKAQGYLSRADAKKIHLALDEAIMNALKHGNDFQSGKRVRFRLYADASRWALVVEDEGKGFTADVARTAMAGAGERKVSGRGIRIMESTFDEVVYMERGNQLLLVRKRSEDDLEAVREALADAPLAMSGERTHKSTRLEDSESELAIVQTDDDEDDDYLGAPAAERIQGELESANDTIRIVRVGGIRVVEMLAEKLSDHNLATVKRLMEEAIAGQSVVVLDLGRVEYMSSVAIGGLVGFATLMENAGGELRLSAVPQMLTEIFDTTGVAELFRSFATYREAAAAAPR
mgnify:FL=1